jgi:electron transport complex protein RnfG
MREIIRLCFVLTVIAAVSAGVLAFVDQKTQEPIASALKAEEMAAVESVLPPFDNEADKDTLTLGDEACSYKFYRGRKGNVIVGAAFTIIAPNGYSGDIKVMVGVDTAGVVQGIEILDHRETPGLGAKIETAEFRNQYKGKSLANPDVWDVMKDGGTFKQITGATISSRAVTHCIARALEFFESNRAVILASSGQREKTDAEGGEKK